MRSVLSVLAALGCLAVALGGCKRKGSDAAPAVPGSPAAAASRSVVLAELPGEQAGDRQYLFAERGGGVAWVDATQGAQRVVHNGREGREYEAIANLVLGPDGRRCAYAARAQGGWRVVVDGREGKSFDEVGPPLFSPDGNHVAYEGKVGASWHLVVDDALSPGGARPRPWKDFTADSSRIVFIDRVDEGGRGRLVLSDLAFRKETVLDERVSRASLGPDRAILAAVSEREGNRQVVTFRMADPQGASLGQASDAVHFVVFSADGASVAYLAERGGEYFVGLDGREEVVPAGENIVDRPAVSSDQRRLAAAVIVAGGVRVREFFKEGWSPGPMYGGIQGLTYSRGGALAFVAEREGKSFVVVNGNEGPPFDRVVSPTFSPDGRFLVYRARDDGARFVVVADANGKTIRQHPRYEQVFPVQFTPDGNVAYGVKAGPQLAWKVEPL